MTSPLSEVTLNLVESLDDALALKRWLGERREVLGVDTETGGLSPHHDELRMVQVGDLKTGWAIPWPLWGGLVQEILRNYQGDFVAHNLSFDYRFLKIRAGIDLPWHRCHDTMTLAALDDPTRAKGLKPLSSMLIDKRATAGEQALHEGMRKQGWTWATVPYSFAPYALYSALDPVLTCHLFNYLHPRVQASSPDVYSLERGITRICTNMMLKGMKIDRPYVLAAIEKLRKFSDETRRWLINNYGVTSPMAARQIGKAMLSTGEELLERERTATGMPKADKSTLEFIQNSSNYPQARELAKYILSIRHAEKIISSYLENFLTMSDSEDVVHASIHPLQARTGRMSVSDPALQTLHRNDKLVRGSFVPRTGNAFISIDASQIEARIAASLSDDKRMIEAFRAADEEGADFFSGVASEIFGEPISKADERRQLTKNTVYGCVPLSTQILTKRGWVSHDDVSADDETIGYNPSSGMSEWTKIISVHHFSNAEVWRIGTGAWNVYVTPDHRWLDVDGNFVRTYDLEDDYKIRITEDEVISTGNFHRDILNSQSVWCVTTKLGTWTMRQGRLTCLTGNSLYGAGYAKMAATAGVSPEVMKPVKEGFDQRFPGLAQLMGQIVHDCRLQMVAGERPHVRTDLGRFLPVEKEKLYSGTNYKIQSTAAESLKMGILNLDAAGFGDYLLIPVHDEVILEVPREQAEEALMTVKKVLDSSTNFTVPVPWDGKIMWDRWEK